MKVLVACEESQVVCSAFRNKGHEAFSCDIVDCSGFHPEWHIKQDVLPLLNGNCEFSTCDGKVHKIVGSWDLIIAHPPCTYLTVTGNRWFNIDKYGEKALQRIIYRDDSSKFFMKFVEADCEKIAIENPIGYMSTFYRKPDQIIQPWQFGDNYSKSTCFWLKGLPKLISIVSDCPALDYVEYTNHVTGKKTRMPKWYAEAWRLPKLERSKLRSKTFPGIAFAMADQWG